MARHRLTVQDVMTAHPITIKADAPLLTAYDLMEERDIRRLPVVNAQGELEGLITLSDVQRALPPEVILEFGDFGEEEKWLDADERASTAKQRAAPRDKRVWQVMAGEPITVAPSDTIQDAAESMLENKISGLPVVEGLKVVGIITESDIFRLVVESWSEPAPA